MRRRNWRITRRLQRVRNQLEHAGAIAIDERSLQSYRTAIETGDQFRRAMLAWRDQQVTGHRRRHGQVGIRVLTQRTFEIAVLLKFEYAGGKSRRAANAM